MCIRDRIKIFYLEDEPFLAKIVKETLESKGFHVTLVEDGSKAYDSFSSSNYDACLLDIMVPNKNGYDIAQEIRKSKPNLPILFLSAKDQTEDVIRGFKVGGNDYIRKPFSMEELIVRINNLVSLAQVDQSSPGSDDIRIGSMYIFSPNKMSLTYKKTTKPLSHREAQILALMCNPIGETTHRKDILLKVWGDDSFYNSRNLDVYISKIRGYFKEDPSIEIRTLKGVGYQFII